MLYFAINIFDDSSKNLAKNKKKALLNTPQKHIFPKPMQSTSKIFSLLPFWSPLYSQKNFKTKL